MENWLLIADTEICDYSKKQIKICSESNLNIKGMILCNEERNKEVPICSKVDMFPTFCNTVENVCFPGFRDTKEKIENLNKEIKEYNNG